MCKNLKKKKDSSFYVNIKEEEKNHETVTFSYSGTDLYLRFAVPTDQMPTATLVDMSRGAQPLEADLQKVLNSYIVGSTTYRALRHGRGGRAASSGKGSSVGPLSLLLLLPLPRLEDVHQSLLLCNPLLDSLLALLHQLGLLLFSSSSG